MSSRLLPFGESSLDNVKSKMSRLLILLLLLKGTILIADDVESIHYKGRDYRLFPVSPEEIHSNVYSDESDDEALQTGARPFEASLQVFVPAYGWRHYCTAAIIDDCKVLAPAHCLTLFPEFSLRVQVGVLDFKTTPEDFSQFINISDVYLHEDYEEGIRSIVNDIGFGFLSQTLVFNEHVQPAKITLSRKVMRNCLMYGRGSVIVDGPLYSVPLETEVRIKPYKICQPVHQQLGFEMTYKQVCLERNSSNYLDVLPCLADGGGLLLCGREHDYLAGIASYTFFCQEHLPAVYTQLVSYFAWIKDHKNDNCRLKVHYEDN
ncbi:neurotrypsin [Biomphalaria pfeifferi]|uniref:Neurotrypsin n=1 Tax=Biomphalaria pfeifferi TaxID=112525 RepID=A0AAD8CBP8_BIOPF|nr:neurotrypsin [Biomphalaria pfeifferi]